MASTSPEPLFPASSTPLTPSELADFEEMLLKSVASVLREQPTRAALAARSAEILALMDDVVADWAALVLAIERAESEETKAQLRTIAEFSSETLGELAKGMTWTEAAGAISAVVKLSKGESGWTYSFAYTDPNSGAVETVAASTSLPTKQDARASAGEAVKAAAKSHGSRADVN